MPPRIATQKSPINSQVDFSDGNRGIADEHSSGNLVVVGLLTQELPYYFLMTMTFIAKLERQPCVASTPLFNRHGMSRVQMIRRARNIVSPPSNGTPRCCTLFTDASVCIFQYLPSRGPSATASGRHETKRFIA